MISKEKYCKNIPQELKACKQWLWFKVYCNKDKDGKKKVRKNTD